MWGCAGCDGGGRECGFWTIQRCTVRYCTAERCSGSLRPRPLLESNRTRSACVSTRCASNHGTAVALSPSSVDLGGLRANQQHRQQRSVGERFRREVAPRVVHARELGVFQLWGCHAAFLCWFGFVVGRYIGREVRTSTDQNSFC